LKHEGLLQIVGDGAVYPRKDTTVHLRPSRTIGVGIIGFDMIPEVVLAEDDEEDGAPSAITRNTCTALPCSSLSWPVYKSIASPVYNSCKLQPLVSDQLVKSLPDFFLILVLRRNMLSYQYELRQYIRSP
jgi:hypothetical protein